MLQLILRFQTPLMWLQCFLNFKLANIETTEPISKWLLAIKPQTNDSTRPLEVGILNGHPAFTG